MLEEKVINGVLQYRNNENADWRPYSTQDLTEKVIYLRTFLEVPKVEVKKQELNCDIIDDYRKNSQN